MKRSAWVIPRLGPSPCGAWILYLAMLEVLLERESSLRRTGL
jgi:hypothetical protein